MNAKQTALKAMLALICAGLLVILSNINLQHVPLSAVPINLAPFAVMLAGVLLGPVYGFFSVLAVVLLTALGVPLLGQQGGLDLLLGRQGGFLWMYPLCAGLLGLAVSKIKGRDAASFGLLFLATFVLGSMLRYLAGVPWYAHLQQVSVMQGVEATFYPRLVGDLLTSCVVAMIAWPLRSGGKAKGKRRRK